MNAITASMKVLNPTLTNSDLADIRSFLLREGYVYLVEIPGGFDHFDQLQRLGAPIPQYDNEFVRDIKPDLTLKSKVYSALTMGKLTPHTEWYEFSGMPPRLVALWGVRMAQGIGGETTLADGYRLLGKFTQCERQAMRERMYSWRGLSSDSGEPVDIAAHPILEDHEDGLILRYSNQFLERADDLAARYIDAGSDFFAAEHIAISIAPGSMLLWDNWRMLHARNAFNDPDRHLRRVLLAASI